MAPRQSSGKMARPALVGMWAAFVSPRWLEGKRFQSLLGFEPELGGGSVRTITESQSEYAIRISRRVLSLLGRLPRSPWRNTCLFRSVAECIILRRVGISARVCLGVRKGEQNSVNAHAWVETNGGPLADSFVGEGEDVDASYMVLQRQGEHARRVGGVLTAPVLTELTNR